MPDEGTVQKTLVIFGNGYWARQIRLFPEYTNKHGKRRRKIKLSLSIQIMDGYEITDTIWTGDYPAEMVEVLSTEHTHPCTLIHCGVKAEKVRHMDRDKELFDIISAYEKNEQSNLLQIAKLEEENEGLREVNEKQLKRFGRMKTMMEGKEKKEEGDVKAGDETSD